MKKLVKKLTIVTAISLTLCATVSAGTGETVVRPQHEQNAG